MGNEYKSKGLAIFNFLWFLNGRQHLVVVYGYALKKAPAQNIQHLKYLIESSFVFHKKQRVNKYTTASYNVH